MTTPTHHTSLEEAILTAVSSCGHSIDSESVTLHFDPKQPGHNALNQLSRRIAAAIAADRQSASRATPEGWVPCLITYEGEEPEEVAFGPQHMMDRLKKWLTSYFAMVYAARYPAATPAGVLPVLQPSVAASDALVLMIDYAIHHGWSYDAQKRIEGIREADKLRAALTANQAAEAPTVAVEETKAVALTDEQIEKLREQTFSTQNPYCPVDSKSMRKAVRAAERAHGIGLDNKEPK